MRGLKTRIGAVGAASLLAVGVALAGAVPASAATTVGDVTWYGPADFGVESGGYPTGVDWFFGDTGATTGTHGFNAAGLSISTDPSQRVQILNQDVTQQADATAFASYLRSVYVLATNSDWSFQVPVFAEPGASPQQFTTLRTAYGDDPSNVATLWTTSGAFGPYAAGDSDTLENIAAALYVGDAPEILAYGLYVGQGYSTTVHGIAFDGLLSAFTPVVTRSITPDPVTPEQSTTSGIRFQGSGWIPGSMVYVAIFVCDGDGPEDELFFDDSTVADSNGMVDFTAVLATLPAVGTYCVYFDDDDLFYFWDVMEQTTITIAEAPLPPTGLEVTVPLAAGSLFLLLGGVALAATRRTARRDQA